MDNKIKVNVVVAGQRFTIVTEKSEKYVRDIADRIESHINSLVITGGMNREKAAVLTAMDFADDNASDKETVTEVKEQIKDYLKEIERLQEDRVKLSGDYNKLKAEYERIIEEHRSAEDAQRALAEAEKAFAEAQSENAGLLNKIEELQNEIEILKNQQSVTAQPAVIEEKDAQDDMVAEESAPITAEDDLFFDEEEEQVKPLPKKKKNRHDHSHVNPYQQKAAQQNKGYTQQRQYSFFDISEEE